jgi:hypothetical protein
MRGRYYIVVDGYGGDFGATLTAASSRAAHSSTQSRRPAPSWTVTGRKCPGGSPSRHPPPLIPALIEEIATYLREPGSEELAANTTVLVKAQLLGELRHAQQA